MFSKTVMNKEMMNRFKEAAMYQRKAIRYLIPERMGNHMDVIGNEFKLMLTEAAAEILKECGRAAFCKEDMKSEEGSTPKKTSRTGKIDIE